MMNKHKSFYDLSKQPLVVTDANHKKYDFRDAHEASKALGCNLPTITACLRGRIKKWEGYTFSLKK